MTPPPRHVLAGSAIALAAAVVFGLIAADIANASALRALDVQVADTFARHTLRGMTRTMASISDLHVTAIILVLVAVLALAIARRREWHWLACLVVAVPGGMALNWLIKQIIARPRPRFPDVATLTSYSFPSGHTAGAALFYGFLAAYLIAHIRTHAMRVIVGLVALFMVALVGFSRIYLRVHYVSDVVGALFESIAWLALCLTAMACAGDRTERRPGNAIRDRA